MAETAMLVGARKLLGVCTRTQPNENVLIFTDPELRELAEPLTFAAAEAGAEATVCLMPVRAAHG
jgi:leucyl aminopeptidase (aminopeptidase T)